MEPSMSRRPVWTGRIAGVFAICALGTLAGPAFAQSGKVKKAEKMIAKFEDGKTNALAKAWDSLSAARVHPDTRDDALTWVLMAETAWAFAMDPDLEAPMPDAWQSTYDAWDTAIAKGARDDYAERVVTGLVILESAANSKATNAYEGGRMDDAWVHMQRVLDTQALIRQAGTLDPAKEVAALKLGLVIATEVGALDDARDLHARLEESGGRRTGQTLTLARAIEGGEGLASAIDFLRPYVEADPDDATMFEALGRWLVEQEQADELTALLEANAGLVGNAPAITLVHAQLWQAIGELARSKAAYEAALKVDGRNQDVLRGYAGLMIAQGRDFAAQAAETKAWRERRALRTQRDEAFMRAMTLLQTSRELEPGHLETLTALREVYDEVELDDPEEIAALDEAIKNAEDAGDGAE
jgi:tetratricopeptide (TPR) repeat protein